MTSTNPLAELRRNGFDADLHHGRVRVWPRHKLTKALAQFVTVNLPEINDELIAEDNMKTVGNVFLWNLPVVDREGNELLPGEIPGYMNGQQFAEVPMPGA